VPPELAHEDFRVLQLDHVEMFVPNRHEAAEWYKRVLGLEIVQECEFWAQDPQGPLMISSDCGSTKLALFRGPTDGAKEDPAFGSWLSASIAVDLWRSSDVLTTCSYGTIADGRSRSIQLLTTVRHIQSTFPIRMAIAWKSPRTIMRLFARRSQRFAVSPVSVGP
jgi:hypothetical protein